MGRMAKVSFRDTNGLGGHGRDLDLALYFTEGPRRTSRISPWWLKYGRALLGTPSDGLHSSKSVLSV